MLLSKRVANDETALLELIASVLTLAGDDPAGLAPAPRDSGRISGNHRRPRRSNRRFMRTCYLAALSSLKNSPASRTFYERKRAEGKSHKQALIALARRRINTLWAMLRDRTPVTGPADQASASPAEVHDQHATADASPLSTSPEN
jgi:hypothetical protein